MNLFRIHSNKQKLNAQNVIFSPVGGKAIPLEEVQDEAFSSGILGPGCAVEPTGNRIIAPVDGTIENCIDTGHAIGIMGDNGAEILIHVGIDTVELRGKFFEVRVKEGQRVKQGAELIRFDAARIRESGYLVTTSIVVTNADELGTVTAMENGRDVREGDEILLIEK